MLNLIDILKVCADDYTNKGEYHTFTDEEKEIIAKYGFDFSISDDNVYDILYNIGKRLYKDDTFFKSVGFSSDSKKVKLPFVMGSMTEAHLGELDKWIQPNVEYTISAKLDGCSAAIIYEDGKLSKAYTRGDGYEGTDITTIVQAFEHKIPQNVIGDLKVRGEIIVPKNDITLMLAELKEETGKTYKNGRNTVAGMLNSKTISKVFSKYAHFVAYHIEDYEGTEMKMFQTLSLNNFETPFYYSSRTPDICEEVLIDRNKDLKEDYEYEIDGVIITKNSKSDEDYGYWTGTINPKCSMKYKVGCVDNYGYSVITNIKWQLSSYGYFKPVIEIEPIDLDGSTITYATGNNYANVIKNHLCIGAKIRIHKAGLVIPFIDETISYPSDEDYNLPKDCKYVLNGVDIVYCENTNAEYDEEMNLQKLIYFCNKVGADFAGEGNIKRLIEITDNKMLSIKQLLDLPVSVFQNSIGVNGIKFYASLHDKIQKLTISQFMDAVSAFGRGIGELKLNKIIEQYKELPYEYDKIVEVDGWSDISAKQYMENYNTFMSWIEYLSNKGIILLFQEESSNREYSHYNVVFTGIRDKNMETIIKSGGGKVLTSFSKKCNLVIAKNIDENSSKIQKAKENNVKIISYEEALKLFL